MWRPTRSPPASASGDSGPFPLPASRWPRPGSVTRSSTAASAAWLTGTYDPKLDLLYWTTGNPCPDYNGDERRGDNLYSDSVLALKPATGELKWHYQFTPHDLHDWDAEQTPMLIDAPFGGRERHLLAQASRNGFFYVLDRIGWPPPAGQAVRREAHLGERHRRRRPAAVAARRRAHGGRRARLSVGGGRHQLVLDRVSSGTGFFYVMALEKCEIYTKTRGRLGRRANPITAATTRKVPGEVPKKFLRALELQTGKIVWEHGQDGPGTQLGRSPLDGRRPGLLRRR